MSESQLEIERRLVNECNTRTIDVGITRELLLELLVKTWAPGCTDSHFQPSQMDLLKMPRNSGERNRVITSK